MNKYPKVTYTHYRVREDNGGYDAPVPRYPKRGRPPTTFMYHRGEKGQRNICPRGGKTICRIDFGKGRYAIGEAVCSMSDNFCYKTGRTLALARAIEVCDPVLRAALEGVI